MTRLSLVAVFVCAFGAGQAVAGPCGGDYEVARGDSLSLIANRLYRDAGKWIRIHAENRDTIGDDPNKILVGARLDLPCIDGLPTGLTRPGVKFQDIQPLQALSDEIDAPDVSGASAVPEPRPPIRVITGNDQIPFSDDSLPGGGMLAEVMAAALRSAFSDDPVENFRINDWGSHLDPLLRENLMDISFPWSKPDCSIDAPPEACQNLLFSDPMFEMLTLLFVDITQPVPMVSAQDLLDHRLCQPTGRMAFVLDEQGRYWLRDDKVTVVQAPTVSACFDLLMANEVDAVVVNEFTGRAAVATMGLGDRIAGLDSRPLGVTSLHAVVSQQNPRARDIMAKLNAGLRSIRRSGRYQEILDRHLTRVWAGL